MIVPSSACVRFGADGLPGVDTSLRLAPAARIQFCPYDDEPPIVSLADGAVAVTITVPDRQHVTQNDVHTARRLAMAASNYAKELAAVLEHQQASDGAAGGEAA
jgi:hypothetical protein